MSEIFIDIENVPGTWALTTISDFTEVLMGQSPPSSTYNDQGIGLPFFQGKAEFTELYPIVKKWCNASNKIAEVDNILLSVRAPVGTVNIANVKCCIGRGLAAIKYTYCPKFVFYYFKLVEKKLDEKGTGTTFRAVSGDVIRNISVYLPPLPEQHRIVAKIEELFSSLDKGIESLKAAQAQLKIYRQAVLKWAFEGKLTNSEVKEGELPDDWRWVESIDLLEYVTSGSRGWAQYYSNYGAIFLRMGNLDHNTVLLDLSDIQYVNLPNKAEGLRSLVHPGDILISITADVGMIALVPDNFPEAYINQHIALARPNSEIIISKYLAWYLASEENGQKQLRELQRGATKVGLGLDDIRSVKVPLCPLDKQQQIVAEIESRLSVCDKLEESITQSLQQAEALRQSILKKAFEGKLVPQDPNDESASVLLQRIRMEREASGTKAPRARVTQRKSRNAMSPGAKIASTGSKRRGRPRKVDA